MITRRTLLRQLAFTSAGIVLAPAFISCSSKPSLLYKNISVTEDQDELLSLISETIIPKTKTPGASDTSVHEFCIKMIDDCMSKKDQEKFLKGLMQFNELAESGHKKEFASMDSSERLKFLTELNERKSEDDVDFFFKTMRGLTLRGYTSSEYFLTNVQGYKIIPGKFQGCVPLNNPS
jgi:Gluconate 2-dehydrogenase subunit 3